MSRSLMLFHVTLLSRALSKVPSAEKFTLVPKAHPFCRPSVLHLLSQKHPSPISGASTSSCHPSIPSTKVSGASFPSAFEQKRTRRSGSKGPTAARASFSASSDSIPLQRNMTSASASAGAEAPHDLDPSAAAILTFWFGDWATSSDLDATAPEVMTQNERMWFAKNEAVDKEIIARFGPLIKPAAKGDLSHWEETALGSLALVVLMDQFSRNCFRGSSDSFAQDSAAVAVARRAVEKGFDKQLPQTMRGFFYLPFMHSEALEDQDLCVQSYSEVCKQAPSGLLQEKAQVTLKFANLHRDIIVRFGRFPHRNPILGRESTEEEIDYVKVHGGF